MTMRSYSSEAMAYPLRELCAMCKLGIERRFDGPVCGALRTEREARGRKVLSILKGHRRLRGFEKGSKLLRIAGCSNVACANFQVDDGERAKLAHSLLANHMLLARKL